jgi:micrococcal nuclease
LADETQVLGENKTVKSIENCNFIGSKNSDKYHTPDCHWSEKIKEENRVCFETIEEARGKGYQAAGCCNR